MQLSSKQINLCINITTMNYELNKQKELLKYIKAQEKIFNKESDKAENKMNKAILVYDKQIELTKDKSKLKELKQNKKTVEKSLKDIQKERIKMNGTIKKIITKIETQINKLK